MKGKTDRVTPTTSIRVSVDLLMRLSAYLERLKESARKAPKRYPPRLSRGKAGMGDAIAYLLFQDDCHQARRRACEDRAAADVENGRFTY